MDITSRLVSTPLCQLLRPSACFHSRNFKSAAGSPRLVHNQSSCKLLQVSYSATCTLSPLRRLPPLILSIILSRTLSQRIPIQTLPLPSQPAYATTSPKSQRSRAGRSQTRAISKSFPVLTLFRSSDLDSFNVDHSLSESTG